MRIFGPFSLAVMIAIGLFWLMAWMITPPDGPLERPQAAPEVAVALPDPEPEPEPEDLSELLEAAPEPPPSVPDLVSPDAVSVAIPDVSVPTPTVSVPVKFSGGPALGSAFGGFGGGSGSGSGAGGYGTGRGFTGKKLVPLSTARPQIPQTAFDQKIEGWVEVVFVVTPEGRVRNIRIIDAEPKGVFEAAMVESISNWIYPSDSKAREVKQRFEFKLGDFRYNWN